MISEINDIHTHVSTLKSAIHNVLPTEFKPNPGFYYSVGIHPWYIDSYSREQWKLLESAACHVQVLAIGESGLDNLRGPGKNEQIVHFEKHIRISEELAKPLIIHSVRTCQDIIHIRKCNKLTQPWIIHGFRGKPQIAEQLLKAGIYISFGEKYQEESLKITPLSHLFIETDESISPIGELYKKAAAIRKCEASLLYTSVQENILKTFRT